MTAVDKVQSHPPVSVIITCYNLERYIGAAIRSVLAQDYRGKAEVIVVDDCSTDSSPEIIKSFAEVRYVPTVQNRGVLLATLAGLEASGSDLVFFLDGDDIWELGKLSAVAQRFDENPVVGLVTHDLNYIDADGASLLRRSRPEAVLGHLHPQERSETIRKGILEIDNFVWLGSAFAIRKSTVDLPGFIEFARTLHDPANTYQDWPLAYWIAAQPGIELDYVPAKLFRYRLHQLNYSGNASTPELLVRNLNRALNTKRAIAEIARLRNLPPRIQHIVNKRVEYCAYGIDLARGRRAKALSGFLRNATDLGRRRVLFKEFVRLLAVQLIGPKRFAKLAARRTFLRNLPVT